MKPVSLILFSFFIFIVLAIFSCSNKAGHDHDTAYNSKMKEDTGRINQVLRAAASAEMPADSLITELDTAAELCKVHGLDSCLAEAFFRKGNLLYGKNRFREALEAYAAADEVAEKNQLFSVKARCFERMASVHLGTDNRPLALSLYYKSLALSEQTGDSSGIARTYNILALYKAEEDDFDTAVTMLNKAMGINRRLNDRRNAIQNEGNLGYIYECSGNLEKASEIYHSLVTELISMDEKWSLPVIYYNLSSLHQRQNDNDSALIYLRKAIEISGSNGDTSMLTVLYGNTGEIFLNMNRLDSARYYLVKSVLFSKVVDDVETELQAINFIVKLDTISGRFRDALLWNQRIQVLKDSVYKQQLRNNSKESELLYENEKKRNLIETQQLAIRAARTEKKVYIISILLSVLILALLSIVMLQQRRNNRRSKLLMEEQLLVHNLQIEKLRQEEEIKHYKLLKAESDLRQKHNEQMSTALALEQKKELLNQIFDKVKSIASGRSTLSVTDINSILTSIKLQLSESPDSDLFNRLLNEVHEDFFVKLKECYPGLTPSEVKYCAYLKARLSNNQIASILNVTQHAVKKTRYRIRKKMELESDASLEEVILKI